MEWATRIILRKNKTDKWDTYTIEWIANNDTNYPNQGAIIISIAGNNMIEISDLNLTKIGEEKLQFIGNRQMDIDWRQIIWLNTFTINEKELFYQTQWWVMQKIEMKELDKYFQETENLSMRQTDKELVSTSYKIQEGAKENSKTGISIDTKSIWVIILILAIIIIIGAIIKLYFKN